MKNRHSFYLRYVLSLFVFLFLLSFITDTGIGQEFPNQSGLKAQIGEGGKLAKQKHQRIREAIRIQKMNTEWLLDIAHVVGTATGIGTNGEPEIRVFAAKAGIRGIPENLDGFSVKTKVTGRFYAHDCPNGPTRRCDRPVPIGVSTGHPDITAGTIGARVTDGTNVYALSNNHVYAAINSATIGDSVIQPGTSDGGSVENDFIGRLADFEPIQFCQIFWIWLICNEANTIDAAIVDVIDPDTGEVLVDTGTPPPPDGYGKPSSTIHPAFGIPDLIGDEDLIQLLGKPVQKYGRTTRLSSGTIDSINATVNVCYDQACSNVARFADQIIIIPGSFSGGGDSGSLIVTNDANKYPVGLLFAGSDTETIANRIDLVLNRFGVTVDGGTAETFRDIGIASVNVPASVPDNDKVSVVVIVKNFGNQNVTDNIIVSLVSDNATPDNTEDDIALGSQTIQGGLSDGASAKLTFTWNTTDVHLGDHMLTCWHDYSDQDSDNDEKTTTVSVVESLTDVAITGISARESVGQGDKVPVVVTLKNVGNKDVTDNITVSLVSDNATPDDTEDDIALSPQTIQGGLSDGEFADLTFLWNTTVANIGSHLLTASYNLSDDVQSNNVGVTTVKVEEPSVADTIHIGDLDGSSKGNRFWRARVTIMVHDAEEQPLAGATVHGTFSDGPSEFTCTTDGNGTCDVKGYQLWLDCLTFTVFNLSHATLTYAPDENHDPDGDSDGTSIVVCRP